MGRFFIFLGILSTLAACGWMGFATTGLADDRFHELITPIVCDDGEELVQNLGSSEYNPTTRRSSRSVNYYCQTDTSNRRDVTLPVVGTIVGPFVFFLLDGIVMIFIGAGFMARRLKKQIFGGIQLSGDNAVSLGTSIQYSNVQGLQTAGLPPEAAEKLKWVLQQLGANFASITDMTETDLADRLAQLDEAYSQGLISSSEHQRLRQQILDNFKGF